MRNGRFRALAIVALAFALVSAACGDNTPSRDDGGNSIALPECLNLGDLYALVGPESEGFENWSDAEVLATAVDGLGGYPVDAPLSITAPGEESGTYDSFVELALTDTAEARLEGGNITEDQVGTTRADYQSSGNDNVIIEGISGSEGSFGWVGYAFYVENSDVVRPFEIDGGDGCVAPSEETIADGTYPIARSLYVYVNKEKANDKPALQAFVDFYLAEGLTTAVSEVGYVQLPDDRIADTQGVWEVEGPDGEPGANLSGDLFVSGSSTVEPISALVAELFNEEAPDVAINVEGPGTGDGFELFCNGETDISDASRPIRDEEAQACADAGVEFIELEVAIDGIAVLTQA
ncbi:MAG: substrate-binding domain-containing protein [Actinomycetota bacterium]